ncbi:MAG: type I restriction enzyme HsdR N-terminal domain-containing protein [Crocinitomicaceae bacterium]
MFPNLNLPKAALKITNKKVWDILQKKFVNLTPEEWVRQNIIHFLIEEKGYSKNLMQSEYTVKYNGLNKRCDIVTFNDELLPSIIVECKAPHIKIDEETFFQIAKYYSTLKAPLLFLSNGIQHVVALINKPESTIKFLEELPSKKELDSLTDNF